MPPKRLDRRGGNEGRLSSLASNEYDNKVVLGDRGSSQRTMLDL